MLAKLKRLQKLKNNFCDERNILCRAAFVLRDIFLCILIGRQSPGGVVVIINIGGVIWIYKRRIMYIMYSLPYSLMLVWANYT